ncbi:MAG TPA: hypothetical protein VGK47_06780 [Nitrososphaeraceae archaeon]
MEELFENLLEAISDFSNTKQAYSLLPRRITKDESDALDTLKYRMQDALNDYIDKRIELSRK